MLRLSLTKCGCGLINISTYKSPFGPPFAPRCPFPATRNCWCELIPAGILSSTVIFLFVYPLPWQCGHFSFTTLPVPPQSGQTLWLTKVPNAVRCCVFIWPVPLHLEQVWISLGVFAPYHYNVNIFHHNWF